MGPDGWRGRRVRGGRLVGATQMTGVTTRDALLLSTVQRVSHAATYSRTSVCWHAQVLQLYRDGLHSSSWEKVHGLRRRGRGLQPESEAVGVRGRREQGVVVLFRAEEGLEQLDRAAVDVAVVVRLQRLEL